MSDPDSAAVFAAIEAIFAGRWDRHLVRLRAACQERMDTDEWRAHIVVGGGPR